MTEAAIPALLVLGLQGSQGLRRNCRQNPTVWCCCREPSLHAQSTYHLGKCRATGLGPSRVGTLKWTVGMIPQSIRSFPQIYLRFELFILGTA